MILGRVEGGVDDRGDPRAAGRRSGPIDRPSSSARAHRPATRSSTPPGPGGGSFDGPTVTVPPLVRDAVVLNRFEAAVAPVAEVSALADAPPGVAARRLRRSPPPRSALDRALRTGERPRRPGRARWSASATRSLADLHAGSADRRR